MQVVIPCGRTGWLFPAPLNELAREALLEIFTYAKDFVRVQYVMKNSDFLTKKVRTEEKIWGEDRWMVEALLITFKSYALNITLRCLPLKAHSIETFKKLRNSVANLQLKVFLLL